MSAQAATFSGTGRPTPPTYMQASSVSISQYNGSNVSGNTRMLSALLIAGVALLSAAQPARADDGQVILATGLGAVAGALIGHSVAGRNGTIVGGAVGAAIGASAATDGYRQRGASYGSYQPGYHHRGYAPAAPVVYAPPVRVRPVVVYEPAYQPMYRPVVRQVVYPVVYRGGYHSHYDSDDRRHDGRGRGHDNRRGDWDNDRGNGYRR